MTTGDDSDDLDDTKALLEGCHRGERRAFKALLERDLDHIRAVTHRQLRGVARRLDQTDDIVHEVVVRVLEREPRFVLSSKDKFRALMGRIVTNHLRNKARDQRRQKRATDRERPISGESIIDAWASPQQAETTPIDRVVRDEQRDSIRFAMLLLDDQDHDVLQMREWDQLPFKEIGDQLGIAEDAARMRHKRALQRLTRGVFLLKAGRLDELPRPT